VELILENLTADLVACRATAMARCMCPRVTLPSSCSVELMLTVVFGVGISKTVCFNGKDAGHLKFL
jgi:hypothetical protein